MVVQVRHILWMLFLTLFLPPGILFILLPLYLWRLFIQFLSLVFCKDNGEMFHCMSNAFASEYPEMFHTNANGVVISSQIVGRHFTLEEVRQEMLRLFQCVRHSGQKDRYPELRQTITSWMGYLFWKWDKNFNIENHVKMYPWPTTRGSPNDHIHTEQVQKMYDELTWKPFAKERSPWELWVWHSSSPSQALMCGRSGSEKEVKTMLVLRCHHSLGDGFSFLKLIFGDAEVNKIKTTIDKQKDGEEERSKVRGQRSNTLKTILMVLMLPVRMLWDMVRLKVREPNPHQWHVSGDKVTGKLCTKFSDLIPVNFVKEIRKVHGTSFHTVIQAAITGGIRNFMMDHGIPIPNYFTCAVSLPMRGHPARLRNHMTSVRLYLPVAVANPWERVKAIHENLAEVRESTVPLAMFYLLSAIGVLPQWIIKMGVRGDPPTCMLSNFAGPLTQLTTFGAPMEEIAIGSGLLRRMGFGFTCISYDGYVRIGVTVDEAILPTRHLVEGLLHKIVEELSVLRTSELVQNKDDCYPEKRNHVITIV